MGLLYFTLHGLENHRCSRRARDGGVSRRSRGIPLQQAFSQVSFARTTQKALRIQPPRAVSARHTHPAIKANPPNGVMAPNQRFFVKHNR